MAHAYTDRSPKLINPTTGDRTELYLAFTDAFAEFSPRVNISLDTFQRKFFDCYHSDSNLSLLITYDQTVAGFCLVTSLDYQGKKTAWISAMGIRHAYRNRGWSHLIMKELLIKCKEQKIDQIILEVQTNNDSAISLFGHYGFDITRKLGKFKLDYPGVPGASDREILVDNTIPFYDNVNSSDLMTFQESSQFIQREKKEHIVFYAMAENEYAGYLLMDHDSGRIRQLFVREKYRRNGIASGLVNYAYQRINPLTMINVTLSNNSLFNFLVRSSFRQELEQFEMVNEC